MAHMIDTMAYKGLTPWHQLGNVIPEEVKTAAEAMHHAGMDWTVALRAAYAMCAGKYTEIPGVFAVTRVNAAGEDMDVIDTVGARYVPIQNAELADWCDTLSLASEGRASVETLGSLDGGRRVWVLMKHNGDGGIQLTNDSSKMEKYLLCCSSHDGTLQLSMRLSAVRVVCHNTLTAALGDNSNVINIRHTKTSKDRLAQAIKAIGSIDSYFDGFTRLAEGLTRTKFDKARYWEIVKALTPVKSEDAPPPQTIERRTVMMDLLENTPGAQPTTAWGAWQALTDYADHYAGTRGVDKSDDLAVAERRAVQSLSTMAEFKQNALDMILAASGDDFGKLALQTVVRNTVQDQEDKASASSTGSALLDSLL